MVSFNSIFLTGLVAASAIAAPVQEQHENKARGGAGKRGLAYNDLNAVAAMNSDAFSWAYNWAELPGGDVGGLEFVPMLWGEKKFNTWEAGVTEALSSGSKHVLSFNEPDLAEQANIAPAVAAVAHKKHMSAYSGQAQIGTPGVTNGNGDMGLGWMRSFLESCSDCPLNFLAVHWYDSASNFPAFKKHIDESVDLALENGMEGVWITEFRGDGDEQSQVEFLEQALPYLDGKDGVSRYAYFMADDMVQGDQLTSVGQAYSA